MDEQDFEGTLVLEQLAAIDRSRSSSRRSTQTTFRAPSR